MTKKPHKKKPTSTSNVHLIGKTWSEVKLSWFWFYFPKKEKDGDNLVDFNYSLSKLPIYKNPRREERNFKVSQNQRYAEENNPLLPSCPLILLYSLKIAVDWYKLLLRFVSPIFIIRLWYRFGFTYNPMESGNLG